ncbi:HTH-type transcriptional regulator iscR [Bibersteinia trehalosi USDA-ARS-USMARC-188]|uniref:HTH-type transcriptional regulator iscR n=5 Tax=Bibersteinia trehalosi TaxID=47735 RepID=W0R837_BIBTR|nr:Fe-S cluster assembly transcriptional regulator IscR [Bibersteinia trehalosi]AGH38633.1 HTH-type transcriptional regulator iscR [Bibersteinia trehalosi USDA-ARS-USMARC-192]AHG81566.1 HTH-type transcriptional regulator iscR [Bibersteinia trehalosi USDA-ARS-USMARC-188]AHG83841.1 HTH-type transcriptional regulator iscR [Bibersteinia trehalosi USDA-ARS-USMARC-189]AHG86622.1 HTH-type transcriptional regulator iscR [Bibersteinia trehalosi USDA-ARS-USMARC-190]OAQ14730.1 Rrf2 family transcriptional
MKLTSRGRYAVTAILDIALHGKTLPVSLADISERQSISLSYLEQLFAQLRRDGIVHSVRGPGGGYQLGKTPEEINVGMIIQAVNESVDVSKCKGNGNCTNNSRCLTHSLWERLENQIEQYLHTITLAELVEENRDHDCEKSHCHDHHH